MKEAGAHAVKLEGGVRVAGRSAVTDAGIPVMGTSASPRRASTRSAATGCRAAATPPTSCSPTRTRSPTPARSPWCWRWCRASWPSRVTAELAIPTVGIGAGPDCDAQVLVWQDMAGLRQGKMQRFVKQYANLAQVIGDAAASYVDEVRRGAFPTAAHTFSAEQAPKP